MDWLLHFKMSSAKVCWTVGSRFESVWDWYIRKKVIVHFAHLWARSECDWEYRVKKHSRIYKNALKDEWDEKRGRKRKRRQKWKHIGTLFPLPLPSGIFLYSSPKSTHVRTYGRSLKSPLIPGFFRTHLINKEFTHYSYLLGRDRARSFFVPNQPSTHLPME